MLFRGLIGIAFVSLCACGGEVVGDPGSGPVPEAASTTGNDTANDEPASDVGEADESASDTGEPATAPAKHRRTARG